MSLFCYPNPALPELLDAWAEGDVPVTCMVPEGVAVGALDAWTEGNVPHPGAPLVRGRLALHAIPFLAQDDYDRLLWLSTVNFVRGEDSFVRAQWAGAPAGLAHLPAGGGNALGKARRLPRSVCHGNRTARGNGDAPVLAGVERDAGRQSDRRPRGWNSRRRAPTLKSMPAPGPPN